MLRCQTAGPIGLRVCTSAGVRVTISDPLRAFDLEKAWTLRTPEQQSVCQSPDNKLVRQQLPPVLAEECMAPGTGKRQVRIT